MRPLLTAVLVLYKIALEESTCCRSLCALPSIGKETGPCALLVYDNSPAGMADSRTEPQMPAAFAYGMQYQRDPANGGVAAAYNAGLLEARSNGSAWLLLLDQDTAVTPEFFHALHAAAQTVPDTVVAIIPSLLQDGHTHSPQQLPRLSHRPLPESLSGLLPMRVTAFNSGAALRVAALQGFPQRYWLDFLDHAIFHELQAAGGRVWLLRARLQHSLSTQRLGTDASLDRYRNVVQAERDFYREYGSSRERAWYHLRRAKQAVGHLLKVRDKRFALLSLQAALNLLPHTPLR